MNLGHNNIKIEKRLIIQAAKQSKSSRNLFRNSVTNDLVETHLPSFTHSRDLRPTTVNTNIEFLTYSYWMGYRYTEG